MSGTYYSWEQSGLAVGADASADPQGRPLVEKLSIDVSAQISGLAGPVSHAAQLAGPGDIAGLDTSLIRRVVPEAGSTDALANHFPFVEFSRTDLPWLFTPATPHADDRLMPFLAIPASTISHRLIFACGPVLSAMDPCQKL